MVGNMGGHVLFDQGEINNGDNAEAHPQSNRS